MSQSHTDPPTRYPRTVISGEKKTHGLFITRVLMVLPTSSIIPVITMAGKTFQAMADDGELALKVDHLQFTVDVLHQVIFQEVLLGDAGEAQQPNHMEVSQ